MAFCERSSCTIVAVSFKVQMSQVLKHCFYHFKLGNHISRLETMEAEYSTAGPGLMSPSASGLYPRPFSSSLANRTFSKEVEWKDENQNPVEDPSKRGLATREKHLCFCDQEADETYQTFKHDRASRLDSGGGDSKAEPLGRTSSYTRRETRLAALNKQEDDTSPRDYKKMYEDALAENDKLKSRLDDSKHELTKIRSQLDKVNQKQDRISERSTVLESEKREKQALEKRVTDMEEELKVLTELKSDNQRLKDENGALIRVISKLSK
uniref:cGMP-dependent protein kinase interacting domain-containing protein n=1 Tax=Oncorhynchus mykiss TaxID=8022 RepID=A0A8C7T0G6_ONCMY